MPPGLTAVLAALGVQGSPGEFTAVENLLGGSFRAIAEMRRDPVAELDAASLASREVRDWLSGLPVGEQAELRVAWVAERIGARMSFGTFTAHIDDLWFPAMDDIVAVLRSGSDRMVLVLDHEELITLSAVNPRGTGPSRSPAARSWSVPARSETCQPAPSGIRDRGPGYVRSHVFAIELQSQRGAGAGNGGSAWAYGSITIGDFTETFIVPLGFWDESEYRRSWRQAFEVLNANPRSASCLMTSMTDPRNSNFLACWPMYREGEDVYIQNAIIFPGETGEAFNPAMPWNHVPPRRAIDEDANKISEWITSMDALREFFG